MNNANEVRSESKTVGLVAATMFLAMIGSSYAISTYVEGAENQTGLVIPALAAEAPQEYFPAQYVNQAAEVEEHIQGF